MRPEQLERAWAAGHITPLAAAAEQPVLQQAMGAERAPQLLLDLAGRYGPGVLVGSGGSMGKRRWCLQPLDHLQAAAAACGHWLAGLGIDPGRCLHLNPLPLHHVSGLLPLVRCQQWGARHLPLAPELLRDPPALAAAVPVAPLAQQGPLLLSLVPTQLHRLLQQPAGVAWLQQLTLIWMGGAPLSPELAQRARQLALPLAPCYGTTETAAMVTALAPAAFLAGAAGCGQPLADVRLRLDPATAALEVSSMRLSPGWLEQGHLLPLPRTADGWWGSGDAAQLSADGLLILGRLDGALLSGGETVFPEPLEQLLLERAAAAALPIAELVLLAEDDPEWGQRLVALVRPAGGLPLQHGLQLPDQLVAALGQLARPLPPSQRPRRWVLCPDLQRNALGKWERQRWQAWLAASGR